jgi:hypothetical protein
MKTRGVLVQGGLALVGLVAAWTTWQRPVERPAAEVTVVDVSVQQLSRLRYQNGNRWVELQREPDGRVLATLSATPAVYPLGTSADGGTPESGATPLVAAVPERQLRGSEAAEKLLERLAPLKASRALGVLESKALEQVGLDNPTQRLTLTAQGRERVYSVSTAVLGLNSPYLRSEQDGSVYLLGPGLVADLEAASSRLVDRRLHSFRLADFDALVVQRGAQKRDFLQRAEGTQAPRLFARQSETADEMVTSWHERVWRSAPVELYGRGEVPPGGEPQPQARLEYLKDGKPVGFMELAPGPEGKVYARTEHTAGWVLLASGTAPLLEESSRVVRASP